MSKADILNRLKANRPVRAFDLPEHPEFSGPAADLSQGFRQMLELNNARVVTLPPGSNLAEVIRTEYPDAVKICSAVPDAPGNFAAASIQQPSDLDGIDLAILPGEVGVAENGAIWLSDRTLPVRVLPFITQHLVIVVDAAKLVPKMHQAYAAIDPAGLGFGVFISGPSKTGDIEQALVIGAHGSLSLCVILRMK
jgi:L-lactate dehydrogenase complex protein LldG